MTAGEHEITFDATTLSSGLYFISLFAENKLQDTQKLVLIK